MPREVFLCDHCGHRTPKPIRLEIVVDRINWTDRDAEDVVEKLYLCIYCMARALADLMVRMPYEKRQAWVDIQRRGGGMD